MEKDTFGKKEITTDEIIPMNQESAELLRDFLIDQVKAMKSYCRISSDMDGNEFAMEVMKKCDQAIETLHKVVRFETLCDFLNKFSYQGLLEPCIRFGTLAVLELSEGSEILAIDELERSRAAKAKKKSSDEKSTGEA